MSRPVYVDMDDNIIHSYILAQNSFLKFEELGLNKRMYSPYEVVIYVVTNLVRDLT